MSLAIGNYMHLISSTFPSVFSIVAGLVCVVLSVGVAYHKGDFEYISEGLPDDERYFATFCSASNLKVANSMVEDLFRDEHAPDDLMEALRRKNPGSMIQVCDQHNRLCGFFMIVADPPAYFDKFVSGELADVDATVDDCLSFNETKLSPTLYISQVVVRDADSMIHGKRVTAMYWIMMQYLKREFDLNHPRTVYALAINDRVGRLLVRRFEFTLVVHGKARKDGLDLYARSIDLDAVEKVEMEYAHYSQVCACNFDSDPTLSAQADGA